MTGTNGGRRRSRRGYLAATGAAAIAGIAGCLDVITGGAAEFEANPSRVPQSVLDETGYELDGVSDREITRTFEAGGESRDVVVTNKLAEHHKSISVPTAGLDGADAAVFTALTTPQVNVLGRNFNPVEDMSAQELAQMVQQQYDMAAAPSEEDEQTVTINGEQTPLVRFRADARFQGNPIELFIHISEAVELGDDFVVVFGGYPTVLSGEGENIVQMAEAVEQGG
ncbi:hypothetical protein GRX03_01465 [Halovenus sp. WSH3]|uniref:Uncharacterized protein n=1 Tax=Halovenus carboxidivorans TaxID=2692199 RepID=A0A6B0TAS4_9EURY|nr:DUF6517 family protein [Halovenus carboxidivorans]MXR50279.1 hypothetical protein [Halovenus carboxidivorans]